MGMNSTLHAKDTAVTNPAGDPTWQPVKSTSGSLQANLTTLMAGEDQTLDRQWGGAKCLYNNATADELIKTGAGVFYGVTVTTALSAAAIDIRDATSAGTGTVIYTIPASATVADTYKFILPVGISFTTGLYADFGGTGTINVLYV